MGKTSRFLFRFAWINLAVLAGAAVVLILGSWLTGVPQGANSLFGKYYMSAPLLVLLALFFIGFSVGGTQLQLALSFGARRRDCFLALQTEFLFYAGGCTLLRVLLAAVPDWFSWARAEELEILTAAFAGGDFLYFPLTCLAFVVFGTASSLLLFSSRAAGVIVMIAAMMAWFAIILGWMLSGFSIFPVSKALLIIAPLLMAAAGEWYIHRAVMHFAVR